jgi:hypothetical protein
MIFMKPGTNVKPDLAIRGRMHKTIIVILIVMCLFIGLFPHLVYDPIYNVIVALGV